MTQNSEKQWPQFEIFTSFDIGDVPIEIASPLVHYGVPKDMFGVYTVSKELTLLEEPDFGLFICFGSTKSRHKFCLNTCNGAIVYVLIDSNSGNVIGEPSFINSSLEQFIQSVQAVVKRFPFDSGVVEKGIDPEYYADNYDSFSIEWDIAANDLEVILRAIDPITMDIVAFWFDFLDDIRNGDFSTEGYPANH